MKNKSYRVLFIFYLLTVAFILYINGVFTGEMSSLSNLIINVVFLAVIGILFLVSVISFSRLNYCTEALSRVTDDIYRAYDNDNRELWEKYKNMKKVFDNDVLDEAFYLYKKRMKSFETKRGLSKVCDIEDYINEDLVDQVGMNYYNSAISGTMTGLGILGTFIGLSIGLGSFNGNDIYTITDNVGPLLEGMKVAFHTSVYGIFFSLIFTFVYRAVMSDAYEKVDEFLAAYRECVEPVVVPTDDNIKAMLLYQANMNTSLKKMTELMQGNALEQTEAVGAIVDKFMAKMEETMNADFTRMGKNLQKACEAQEVYAENYKTMAETSQVLLNASLTLQKTLEQTMERQEAMMQEMKDQEQRITTMCDTITDEIRAQLYTLDKVKE